MKWRFAFLFLLIVGAATDLQWASAQQPPAIGRSTSRVALLMADSAYRDVDSKIPNPARDGGALADELRRHGFEVTLRGDLGKEDMQRAIDAFQATMAPGAAALFFVPEGALATSSASLDNVHDDTDSNPSLFMSERLKELHTPTSATAEQVFFRARSSVAPSNGDRVPWVFSSLTKDFTISQPPTSETVPLPVRKAEQLSPSMGAAPFGSTVSGETLRDCEECPEMVVIPAGEFDMGSNDTIMEKPIHRVAIRRPIAIGRREITFAEWDQCVAAGACKYRPDDRGWGRGDRPLIDVSWDDAKLFLNWLSQKTGQRYRLPTEAEWEYAARAGTTSRYWWGRDAGNGLANCDGCGAPGGGLMTTPAGSFRPNAFGLYDTAGNVAEWVEDCWNDSYRGAPKDGSAWTTGQCRLRVLRGGSFGNSATAIRSAARFRYDQDVRYFANGFRPARDP
jgi:formylglycine-generating enzyme required for sulfatase activity